MAGTSPESTKYGCRRGIHRTSSNILDVSLVDKVKRSFRSTLPR